MKALIPVYIHTRIISNGKSYKGVIGNLSENKAFVETDSAKTATPFMPRRKLKLKFHVSSNKTITVNGEIKWLHSEKNATNGLTNNINLELMNPSPTYKEFLKTL